MSIRELTAGFFQNILKEMDCPDIEDRDDREKEAWQELVVKELTLLYEKAGSTKGIDVTAHELALRVARSWFALPAAFRLFLEHGHASMPGQFTMPGVANLSISEKLLHSWLAEMLVGVCPNCETKGELYDGCPSCPGFGYA